MEGAGVGRVGVDDGLCGVRGEGGGFRLVYYIHVYILLYKNGNDHFSIHRALSGPGVTHLGNIFLITPPGGFTTFADAHSCHYAAAVRAVNPL